MRTNTRYTLSRRQVYAYFQSFSVRLVEKWVVLVSKDNSNSYASEVHTYDTRYASKSNFYKPRFRTNIGKQTTSAMVTEMWQQLPTHVKNFSTHNFPKKLKEYLLAEQLTD